MIAAPRTAFWRVGIVPAKIAVCQDPARLRALRHHITWLPEPEAWRYLANPFAILRDGALHVFVEAYDYRTQHASIEYYEYSFNLELRGRSVALMDAGHLTYPFLVEEDGEVFMIPENRRANEIVLHRALDFPLGWRREAVLLPDTAGGEPSLIRHEDRWWMFFTVTARENSEPRLLAAYAPRLSGPWTLHPQNPIPHGLHGVRPGGTPFAGPDGAIMLPLRDTSAGISCALRFIRFRELGPHHLAVEPLHQRLTGELVSDEYPDGLHTLSACSGLTLLDVKRTDLRWWRHGINLQRRLARFGEWSRHG